jgi:hypothetical protein
MIMAFHRLFSHALLSSALLTAGSAWAAAPQKGMVPGFLDPKTGAFTAQVGPQQPQGMVGELATYTGTLTMKFNITLKSGIPADYQIQCTQGASVSDSVATYSESKTVVATRSGSTATCTVGIYYSWSLSSGSQVVSQTYSVDTYGAGGSLVQRGSFVYGLFVDMPANGGSSTRTFNVTL